MNTNVTVTITVTVTVTVNMSLLICHCVNKSLGTDMSLIFLVFFFFSGFGEIVKLLLENNADYTIAGEFGTAKAVAEMYHEHIANLIPGTAVVMKVYFF